MHIYPSLIAADQLHLAKVIAELDPIAHGYHLDVMDFHFVPNLTLSFDAINAIARSSRRPLWIHLMVTDPLKALDYLQIAPGSIVTFHVEIPGDVQSVVNLILHRKWKPSIAVRPSTVINKAFPYLEYIHQVLIMSVEPGFSGQLFLPETIKKIEPLVGYKESRKLNFRIAFDGGIKAEHFSELKQKGVNDCAIGSEIFKGGEPVERLKKLVELGK